MNTTQPGICDLGLKLIERATLSEGSHGDVPKDPNEPCPCCVMELRSQALYLCGLLDTDGESDTSWWSGMPKGDSIVIVEFLQVCNDRWIPTDAKYGEDLKQFAPMDLRDKGPEIELKRMFLAADWAVRTIMPMYFDNIGFPEKAQSLRDLSPIIDKQSTNAAWFVLVAMHGVDAYHIATHIADSVYDYDNDNDPEEIAEATAHAAADAADYSAPREPYWKECMSIIHQMIALGVSA